jgi:hypothetical protein
MASELSVKGIGERIYVIRGHWVMLDSDLALLYGVETRALNQAVRRNRHRFPDDFMFELSRPEFDFLMSQTVISKADPRGGRRKLPLAFTEQGVAMLSSVLRSKHAVQVNIAIMRSFVRFRELLYTNKDLSIKIDQLERKFVRHDEQFKAVFEAIRQLMSVGSPLVQRRVKGLSDR